MTAPAGQVTDDTDAMLESTRQRIRILDLDLSGLEIVTEAATGAYAATAVVAALAGARVHACARGTRLHGSADDAIAATLALAEAAGVETRISFSRGVMPEALQRSAILTNSGRIRPITRAMVGLLPPQAVVALMFEAWEFRGTDIDLAACRERGIRVAAVNERHPDVAVFPFLGPLAIHLLGDAGLLVAGKRIAIMCDNPFASFLVEGLTGAGAEAVLFDGPPHLADGPWDAILMALLPRGMPLGQRDLEILAGKAPGTLLAQFWGDIDREAVARLALRICPETEPGRGHMGILLNRLGHEPIVRLQAGGLKAAELVWHGAPLPAGGIATLLS